MSYGASLTLDRETEIWDGQTLTMISRSTIPVRIALILP